jgi:hypothetical protein
VEELWAREWSKGTGERREEGRLVGSGGHKGGSDVEGCSVVRVEGERLRPKTNYLRSKREEGTRDK